MLLVPGGDVMKIKEKYSHKTKQALGLLLDINVPYIEACRILGLHLVREGRQKIIKKGGNHG